MIRSLAFLFVAVVLGAVLCGPFTALHLGEIVLGGHYHVGTGESLNTDTSFYFAQVTIDEGASVEGHVFLYSSTLDLRGRVAEDIHAFESDLTLRESAQVEGEIDEKDIFHWTFLLPAMAHIH